MCTCDLYNNMMMSFNDKYQLIQLINSFKFSDLAKLTSLLLDRFMDDISYVKTFINAKITLYQRLSYSNL